MWIGNSLFTNCALKLNNRSDLSTGTLEFTDDLALFVKLAKNGKFYEYLQLKLGLPDGEIGRKMAKQMAFEIFFSGVGIRGNKKVVMGLFPTLIRLTEGYKKKQILWKFPIYNNC